MKELNRTKLEKLMGDHLIGWYVQEDGAMKAHYKVTPENLLDFIEKFVLPHITRTKE